MKQSNLVQAIEAAGFCFVPGESLQAWLLAQEDTALSDWEAFAASWDGMPIDRYMADGGRYRRRRYATLSAAGAEGELKLEPHQPHFQSLDYNPLDGGIPREFDPIPAEIMGGRTMGNVLRFCQRAFGRLRPNTAWHIECHQFRIEAGDTGLGKPTPEGVHRDGVDFVLVMMVRRTNISSGTTTMHDLAQKKLDSFTLTNPLDAAIVDDRRCMHGVTPVERIDPTQPAYRDVLVVTFRAR